MTGVLDHVNLNLLQTSDQIPDFYDFLNRRRDMLGVDTESSGLSHTRDVLRMCQFGDLNEGWAIPWDGWKGLSVEALSKYTGPLVLHNAPHDVKFLTHNSAKLGPWPWDRTNDTLTITHLVDSLRSKNLKTFAGTHIDSSASAAQKSLDEAMDKNKWTWGTVPDNYPDYWVYAAMDPVLTCHIVNKYRHETIDGPSRAAYGLEMGTLRVITNMMIKGCLVDLDYCSRQMDELGEYSGQIMKHLSSTYDVNTVWSEQQITAAMGQLGVTPLARTKNGAPSWTKDTLELVDDDLARYILGVRKIEKQLGPYFGNFLTMADADGRVHPYIWSMGARTGRQSIEKPAMQQLPKKDPTVRNAFIPAPGHVLISIDADQIEARLAAHFSQDPGMIAAFRSDVDFFVALARRIFGEPNFQKDDPRRGLIKNTIYGRIYGAGVLKMAIQSRVSLDQMEQFRIAFNQMFPGIDQLQARVNSIGSQRRRAEGQAYVLTPYGRRLVADDHRDYTLLNYLIQGHASEILKRCMVELDMAGMGPFMILPVHDEILMEVPVEFAPEVLGRAEAIMNDETGYAVPITWSGSVMDKRWGQKYEVAA